MVRMFNYLHWHSPIPISRFNCWSLYISASDFLSWPFTLGLSKIRCLSNLVWVIYLSDPTYIVDLLHESIFLFLSSCHLQSPYWLMKDYGFRSPSIDVTSFSLFWFVRKKISVLLIFSPSHHASMELKTELRRNDTHFF